MHKVFRGNKAFKIWHLGRLHRSILPTSMKPALETFQEGIKPNIS
jgi:hypothetical protein